MEVDLFEEDQKSLELAFKVLDKKGKGTVNIDDLLKLML